MEKQKRIIFGIMITVLIISNTALLLNTSRTEATVPYFTLVAKTNGGGVRPDYLNLLKQQLASIGIILDVIVQDWPTFVGELIAYRDFDICYTDLTGSNHVEPDMSGIYNENGSLNFFGYRDEMDYDETLNTGLNEWYIKEGVKILPPTGQERIEHYWAWQQHLMDKILPCLPTFAPKNYVSHWKNLNGYNMSDGILQSWGKMSWDGTHNGQLNTNEVVISDVAWSTLNSLFPDDPAGNFISSAIMDPLIYYDDDASAWPHLATNWTYLTDTQIRISLREGVKWQTDPDGLFPNEYFDAEDVYFTFSILNNHVSADWITWFEEIKIVDDYTIDFYLKNDQFGLEPQPTATVLPQFGKQIFPEHYLNQTQLTDGVTPDSDHPSWQTYTSKCFGTGLFNLTDFKEGVETILTVNPNSWHLNNSLTNDPALNWEQRFGNLSASPSQLRIRIIPEIQYALQEFEAGKIDIIGIKTEDYKDYWICHPNYNVQSDIQFSLGFFGFNMLPARTVIGNPDPAPGNASLSVGLAIRKAICYAANLVEINDVVHGGEYAIIYHPIYTKLGIWCNPNIIKYEHDLDLAEEYFISIAGYYIYDYSGLTGAIGNYWVYSLSTIVSSLAILFVIWKKHSKK